MLYCTNSMIEAQMQPEYLKQILTIERNVSAQIETAKSILKAEFRAIDAAHTRGPKSRKFEQPKRIEEKTIFDLAQSDPVLAKLLRRMQA